MRYLSDMLGAMRDDRPPAAFAAIREAFGALATTVRETMDDLAAGRGMTGDSYERLNALLNFQHSLEAAADTLTGSPASGRHSAKAKTAAATSVRSSKASMPSSWPCATSSTITTATTGRCWP